MGYLERGNADRIGAGCIVCFLHCRTAFEEMRMKLSRPILGNLGRPKKRKLSVREELENWIKAGPNLSPELPHEWPHHIRMWRYD